MDSKNKILRYLIPGFIFQSIVIGGGYGTGAEIAQFFGVNGLVGGLMGMVVTLVVWSALCAITFEFVRVFETYDYNSMMGKLLGKAGILYEVCYVVLLLIVLGVVNATAGSMLSTMTGLSPWIGIILLSIGIIILVLKGTKAIEDVLSFWSYVLYAVYILFMVIVFSKYGSTIAAEFAKAEVGANWFIDGLKYSFYNLGIVPALLYTVRGAKSRKDVVISGTLAGAIGIIPAALLMLAMAADLPGVMAAEVPVTVIFNKLNMTWLYVIFEIVLFGTLIETGTGFIKAVDDRIELSMEKQGKPVPTWVRPTITFGLVIVGICVSSFGLIGLIAKGYGTICWGFLVVYVLPMVTLGVYKISKAGKAAD
ncbi:MAG TPA: hypothetical protein VN369_01000 [Terriglobales bacterium]|nr:hypothetical protein [Terriglobales bacterium]